MNKFKILPLVRKSVFAYKKQTSGPVVSRASVGRLHSTDRVIIFFTTGPFSHAL